MRSPARATVGLPGSKKARPPPSEGCRVAARSSTRLFWVSSLASLDRDASSQPARSRTRRNARFRLTIAEWAYITRHDRSRAHPRGPRLQQDGGLPPEAIPDGIRAIEELGSELGWTVST